MDGLQKARRQIDRCDKALARVFEKRMTAVKAVAEYKAKNGVKIENKQRENEVIENGKALVSPTLSPYFAKLLQSNMDISKQYQKSLLELDTPFDKIANCGKYFDLCRRVLIVTDDGVPKEYVQAVKAQCKAPFVFVLAQGEESKNTENLLKICEFALENNLDRHDCVVAVGGGVVCDLAGLVASIYMRGIDCYYVPTTLLAQVDASIGGKTAVDFGGFKNILGTFCEPKCVLIDVELLKSLPKRQFANGMAEVIKIACISDEELFEMLENDAETEQIVQRAVALKKQVVLEDLYDNGKRKILNFGHTIGHAIELKGDLLHGECVAIGMVKMTAQKERLCKLLQKYGLPTEYDGKIEILHDKKQSGAEIDTVYCEKIGSYTIKTEKLS